MTYRVRRQAITGKLVLERPDSEGWRDCRPKDMPQLLTEPRVAFFIVSPDEWNGAMTRIARYEKRASAQRNARRKAEQKGVTP